MIAAVGLEQDGELVGVGTLERPKARALCDGVTAEASRVCSIGTRNACSMIYGALARAAAALGYRRLITYTLATEPGSSVSGAGFTRVAETKARDWDAERHSPSLFAERAPQSAARVRWERLL